jgi:hypothetical protein
MWFVTRRRHEAELAAAKAEADRLRTERDATVSKLATAVYNREQVLRQNAEQDAANRRLHGRILELGRRLSQLREADPEYAAQLEHRVTRLRRVGVRILAAYAAEKKRADRLQARLDNACSAASCPCPAADRRTQRQAPAAPSHGRTR